MKKIIQVFIIVLLIGIMLMSSVLLLKDTMENKEQEEIFENLACEIQNNIEDSTEEGIDYSSIFAQNNDMVAWIKIDNTNINYPVMQTKENPDYYLRRNFYKEYSYYGTPYIEESCDINTSDNIVIYGHHIKNNKMFGELENYKNKNYYEEHKIIDFITKEDNSKYEIIAVLKTVVYSDKGFKYYEYINIQDEKEFNTFINKCKELSFYDTGVSSNYGDKLITLSTCEYSNQNGRLVIVARKI